MDKKLIREEQPDPANYRDMCQPFDSVDEATEAIMAFGGAVSDARRRCKIADVIIVLSTNYLNDEGAETWAQCTMEYGDQLKHVPMLAQAFVTAQDKFDEAMAKIGYVKQPKKKGRATTPDNKPTEPEAV